VTLDELLARRPSPWTLDVIPASVNRYRPFDYAFATRMQRQNINFAARPLNILVLLQVYSLLIFPLCVCVNVC